MMCAVSSRKLHARESPAKGRDVIFGVQLNKGTHTIVMPTPIRFCFLVALAVSFLGADIFGPSSALATEDSIRNALARKNCVRGKFKDYHLQARGGDPPPTYSGRVFRLSQDYPDQLGPKEDYPWLKIAFENGGPVDPQAYLRALLDYGLEGNVDVDFYVEDNKVRKWYGMPWMDWNTEVVADWRVPMVVNSCTGSPTNSIRPAGRSARSRTHSSIPGRVPISTIAPHSGSVRSIAIRMIRSRGR
jgi:hypothetical protein